MAAKRANSMNWTGTALLSVEEMDSDQMEWVVACLNGGDDEALGKLRQDFVPRSTHAQKTVGTAAFGNARARAYAKARAASTQIVATSSCHRCFAEHADLGTRRHRTL